MGGFHTREEGTGPGSSSHPGADDQTTSAQDDQITFKDAEVVINEDGDDLDFRVEASGEANALVVQGSDGNVGLGTDSPAETLHIVGDQKNIVLQTATNNEDDTNSILFRNSGTSLMWRIGRRYDAGINTSNNANLVISGGYPSNTDYEALVDRLTIHQAGDVEIATGNLKIGTAGKGIDFSAQASPAAGMTAELLDRYEVGTWTPTLSGPSSISYGSQSGLYSRIGSLVTIKFYLSVSFTSGSYFRLEGLPFTCGTVSGDAIAISFQNMESGVAPIFYAVNSTTYCNAYEINALSVAWVPPTASGKYVIGSGSYTVQ